MKHVVVTGADGLLGSNLTRELVRRGYDVHALVHSESTSATLAGLPVQVHRGDVCDTSLLESVFAGARYIFHCAAITDVRAPSTAAWRVNYGGTQRVLDACLRADVERLVFVGSASSYQAGDALHPGDETSERCSDHDALEYVRSKYAATELVRSYVRERRLDAVILAPTFMLGPHDSRPSSGELIVEYLKRRLRLVPPGGRNFVQVEHVALATANAVNMGRCGESYILGGENLGYLEFFTEVARVAGVPRPAAIVPAPVVRTVGLLGNGYERICRRTAPINLRLARLACAETFYRTDKATRELALPRTNIAVAVESAFESLIGHGHLKSNWRNHA